MARPLCRSLSILILSILFASLAARGDEGMWLFNDLPRDYLQAKYGFRPDQEWIDHLMLASVRFNSGGSGSFVSSSGLVLTNHHVAADTIQKLSTAQDNYLENGFLAQSLDQELKAPDLELNRLVSIEDVTERVQGAVREGMTGAEAFAARRAVIAEIEKESLDRTGLRSNVVTLYGGGQYHLYRYKRYTDVRLVWAPEVAAAFFGGDADNFEYPRYCLDAALFRVYEDGKPAQIDHYLKMSSRPLEQGELVFVSGNPGRTDRGETIDALRFRRDVVFPYYLNLLRRREIMLQQYGQESPERERQARDELFGVQNARKAYTGMLGGLQDPSLMEAKQREEAELRMRIDGRAELRGALEAYDRIAQAQEARRELFPQYYLFEQSHALQSQLFQYARTLVRMAAEDQKANTERLQEYAEQNRESLLQQLYSPAPIYKELEQAKLASSLGLLAEMLGGDDPLVQEVLDGASPRERAAELISGTRLDQVAVRRQLAEGGAQAIERSDDPMILLAKKIDPAARQTRKRFEEEVAEVERQAYGAITEARFQIYGTTIYPDATFTPRLAFGTIDGYLEAGDPVPPWTVLGGAFEHETSHGAEPPWKLPESWHARRAEMNLQVSLNFVSTADVTGGNSGSPTVDQQGELIGVIFDGNIYSLTLDFLYTQEQARAISVASAAVLEVLGSVYQADHLLEELRK